MGQKPFCKQNYLIMKFPIFSDVDECSTPANTCRYACKNLVGSFMCVCPEGYVESGRDQCRGKKH